MSKLINVNCLRSYILLVAKITLNHVLYQIQVTALLPFCLSILRLLLQLPKIMLWSTVKLLLAIVMSIIFGPFKLFRGHRKVATVQLSGFSSIFFRLFYFIHLIATWSYQSKSVVSGQLVFQQKSYLCTSLKAGFLATRNMNRIDVGLARSYGKLLLSSWKTYMCNLMAWYINK